MNFSKRVTQNLKCSLTLLIVCPATMIQGQTSSNAPTLRSLKGKPNILWVYVEDTNPWMSCYGDEVIKTPNIDKLASEGVRFNRAYMTAGVCSPVRSAILTGMYATSIGAHNHNSSYSIWNGIEMDVWDPNYIGVRTLPEMFKAAGYYTFNEGKEHYNFVYDSDDLYHHHNPGFDFKGAKNGSEWTGRKEGQPFFGQIQLRGGKRQNSPVIVKPEDVPVPPYYPDHSVFRENIAFHYNTILSLDKELGEIVAKLKEDGLYENTVIFFFSDHGYRGMREKQWLYEGGIRVPLIIAGPGIQANQVRKDLVSGIDISATTLKLAEIDIPGHMQGMDMFAPDFNRDYVIAARDRCDFTIDRVRAVVTERYKYIRNYMTDRPYLQSSYRDNWETKQMLKSMYKEGKLNEAQSHFVSDYRPAEELYDLHEDPYEINNLVHSYKREHAMELAKHRDILYKWIIETDDQGRFPEADEGLDATIQSWGDRAVNKEYKRVRKQKEYE